MIDFKLMSDSSFRAVYRYKSDDEDITLVFDKDMKTVTIHWSSFIITGAEWQPWESDWEKHSCKHGHWEAQTLICLSPEDIEFINQKCKEIFK